jgi:carbamoyltransferase
VPILGLSGLAHDPAAALLDAKGIVAAIEESKLLRTRSASGIPREAIRFCLQRAGITWRDVEFLAVASRPVRAWARQAWLRVRRAPVAPVESGYYQTKFFGELGRNLNNDRVLRLMGELPRDRVVHLNHQLCHAASAFFASPSDRALVLSLDEQGDGQAGMIALGEGTRLTVLEEIAFPHSLGWVYSQVTNLLGFTPGRDEHKTQWLSLHGEPAFVDLFRAMLRSASGVLPHLDSGYFNPGLAGRIAFSEKFYRGIGISVKSARADQDSLAGALGEDLRRQLAASVQQACADIVVEMAEAFRKRTGARALCCAGGLFLNPLLVAEVERRTGFDEVHVQPAAGNEGTALGAAWLVWHERLKKPRGAPLAHLYLGPSYSNHEIKAVVDNCKARYRWYDTEDQKMDDVIRWLDAGKIVAWYQGAAEFGPRALGNRSLLGSAWAPYVKENLNEYVKHREEFRPFAVSMPAEDAARYFECSPNGRFMATMGRVKPEARALLEGFALPGDRVRLHVVEESANPPLWCLLKRFGQRAPAPMLVNTSFNLFGEPLVISPRDAVRSYFCSGIDVLVPGSFSLAKD